MLQQTDARVLAAVARGMATVSSVGTELSLSQAEVGDAITRLLATGRLVQISAIPAFVLSQRK